MAEENVRVTAVADAIVKDFALFGSLYGKAIEIGPEMYRDIARVALAAVDALEPQPADAWRLCAAIEEKVAEACAAWDNNDDEGATKLGYRDGWLLSEFLGYVAATTALLFARAEVVESSLLQTEDNK